MRVGNISDGATSALEQTITANGQTVAVDVNTSQVIISAAANYTGTLLSTSDAEEGQRITVRYDGANYVDIPNSANVLNKHKLTMRLMAGQSIEYMFDGAKWREINRVFNSIDVNARLSFDYVTQRYTPLLQYDEVDASSSNHITAPEQYYLDCGALPGSGGGGLNQLDTVISTPNDTMNLTLSNGGGAVTITVLGDTVTINYNAGVTTVADIEAAIGTGIQPIFVKTAGTGANVLAAGDGFVTQAFANGVDMVVTCDNYDIITVVASSRMKSATGSYPGQNILYYPVAGGVKYTGSSLYAGVAYALTTASMQLKVSPGDVIKVAGGYPTGAIDRIIYTESGTTLGGSYFSCESTL